MEHPMNSTDTTRSLSLHHYLLALIDKRRVAWVQQSLDFRGLASAGARHRLDQVIESRLSGLKWNPRRAGDKYRIQQICAKLDESSTLVRALLDVPS
jgi:hypothetical protein